MNSATHIAPEDLNLFALQFLASDEAEQAAEHLSRCAECRGELGRIHGDLCTYAMTAEMHTPPPAARERLLRGVQQERKPVVMQRAQPAVNDEVGEPTLASRAGRGLDARPNADIRSNVVTMRKPAIGWLGYVGWAAAACTATVAGMQVRDRHELQHTISGQNIALARVSADADRAQQVLSAITDHDALQVAMHLPASDVNEPPTPQGHASYMPGTGTLVFVASHMPQLEDYKTYELWVLPKDGRSPVPAGLFKPDTLGNATVTMPEIPKGIPAQGFGVTIEDDGGSKAGPTKPIVLVGVGV